MKCNSKCNCNCDTQHDSTITLSQETSGRARDLPEKDAEYIKNLEQQIKDKNTIITNLHRYLENADANLRDLNAKFKKLDNNNILNSLDNIRLNLTDTRSFMLNTDLDLLTAEKTIKEARAKIQLILNNEQKTWMRIVKMQQDLDKENF